MKPAGLYELKALIARHARTDTKSLQSMPGLLFAFEPRPTPPCELIVEPVFSLIAQGAKRVEVGKLAFDYRAGQFLIASVDLPVNAYVVRATPKLPCLGFGMLLRAEAISSLLQESGGRRPAGENEPGIATSDLSNDLVDSVVRLLRLLDRPTDIPVLAASLEREVLWRLLNGPQGAIIRQIGLADSRVSQIGRVVRWFRSHFAEPIRIGTLADIAGMSVTSLHRHFRIVTSMTPIQYQKQLRLQAARARLISTKENVAEIGFAVGYESASQFSREYKRMYGRPPAQDCMDLRARQSSRVA